MKRAKLLHNPKAGDEAHDKKKLISLVESGGMECIYSSIKKEGWDEPNPEIDLLIVAGGDGTVRKVVKKLLKGRLAKSSWPPIALLPLGTANNIATTLGLHDKKMEDMVGLWQNNKRKKFDLGALYGTDDYSFFLESFGYGIFPYLITQMEKGNDSKPESPEGHLRKALETLYKFILSYQPRDCNLEIDGKDHSGRYIMVELMNTKMLGPNIGLAMNSDPGDGVLEVVLVAEKDKGKFAAFILDKINGLQTEYDFETIKGREIGISWDGTHVHADDEVIKIAKQEQVRVELKPGILEFLVP